MFSAHDKHFSFFGLHLGKFKDEGLVLIIVYSGPFRQFMNTLSQPRIRAGLERNDFGLKICLNSPIRSAVVQARNQFPTLNTDLDLTLAYTFGIGTFARKNKVSALGDCFPQPCSSAGRTIHDHV